MSGSPWWVWSGGAPIHYAMVRRRITEFLRLRSRAPGLREQLEGRLEDTERPLVRLRSGGGS